ncbi:MAG TPA: hypothetical protein DGG95_15970 [Cytophagales bacterium]|jgi:hypothetical protein|nr:hypothetical protein [Cytophagales bacterium]
MIQSSKTKNISTKAIYLTMGFLFVLLQIGFHPTYLQYFPQFTGFNWIHHVHGALMVSWLVMLVIQPYLIHHGKYKAHRLIGKISYVTAPLIFISMILATKQNYLTTVNKIPFKDVAHIQSLNFITPIIFLFFYTLAIVHRRDIFKHQRYMIGTSFVLLTAIVSRILQHSFEANTIEPYDYFIPLYLGLSISTLLLAYDFLKKENPVPYTIVTITLLFNIVIFHARYTEQWQSFVRYIGDKLF